MPDCIYTKYRCLVSLIQFFFLNVYAIDIVNTV